MEVCGASLFQALDRYQRYQGRGLCCPGAVSIGLVTSFEEFLKKRGDRAGRPHISVRNIWETNVLDDSFDSPASEYATSEGGWSEEMRKNRQTEPRYRRWAVDLVAKRGEVRVSTLVNGGAEVHECSTSATEK